MDGGKEVKEGGKDGSQYGRDDGSANGEGDDYGAGKVVDKVEGLISSCCGVFASTQAYK